MEGFRSLSFAEAEALFLSLDTRAQGELLTRAARERAPALDAPAPARRRGRPVPAGADAETRESLLRLLDEPTRKEVSALLAYAEDEAGGLMSPRYVRLRPDMSVDEAIKYLRRAARERAETIYYIYVLDAEQRLLGVVSFRELFGAPPERTVRDVMRDRRALGARRPRPGGGRQRDGREQADGGARWSTREGRIKGIVTVDDIVDVVREEATEDIQKIGGTAALDAPYLEVGVRELVRKRAGWLTVLFLGAAAHRDRDGLLRGRDRARGGARAVHPADHLERRQLGLAGEHARDPRAGDGRGAPARLVARVRARARHELRARDDPRR